MPTATERVLAELQQGFPSREIPAGTYATIAAQVGVTKQLAQKVGAKAGFVVVPAPKSGPTCQQCGQPVSYEGAVCRPCRWVTVGCSQCGKTLKRRAAELALRKRSGQYSGRVFCNMGCVGRYRKGKPRGGVQTTIPDGSGT